MAGSAPKDFFNQPKKPTSPTTQFGSPSSFTAAADTQAKDYDRIMGEYEKLKNSFTQNPLTFNSISPQTAPYSASADVTGALSNLSELSRTGGYSDQGIADLRARGVSPVRSIYASAQRNLDRGRALSGGYSPNYGALTAKMAREQSNEIGNQLTNVNAGIAQNVASNRLSAAPNYGSAALSENAARTASDKSNADIINQINEFNAQNTMEASRFNRGGATNAIEGMRNLYGTTPALTSLFGNQVGQAANINQNQQQLDQQKMRNFIPMFS